MDFTIKESILGVDSPIIKPNPGFLTQVGEERFRKLVDEHYENIRDSGIAFMFPVEYDDEFTKVKKHAADFFIQICGGRIISLKRAEIPVCWGVISVFGLMNGAGRFGLSLLHPFCLNSKKRGLILSISNHFGIIWNVFPASSSIFRLLNKSRNYFFFNKL